MSIISAHHFHHKYIKEHPEDNTRGNTALSCLLPASGVEEHSVINPERQSAGMYKLAISSAAVK